MEGILKNIKFFTKERENQEAIEQYREILRDLERLRTQIEQVDSNLTWLPMRTLWKVIFMRPTRLRPAIVFCCGKRKNKSPGWGRRLFSLA